MELEFKTNIYEDEEKAFEYIMKIVEELDIKIGKQIFKGYPGLMLGLWQGQKKKIKERYGRINWKYIRLCKSRLYRLCNNDKWWMGKPEKHIFGIIRLRKE